jgi:serine/threonine-protein kinase
MSEVYVGVQASLGREVAVKVLRPNDRHDFAVFVARFRREARALARVRHPNVVGILDHGVADGRAYMVMEFIQGPDLKAYVRKNGMSAALALTVIDQLCRALGEAHAQGIVHRDIKHSNVFLCHDPAGDVAVRLVDFGIVRDVESKEGLTRGNLVVGTPRFMSPEQAKSETIDGRSDIYSLGVLLYWMLMTKTPFFRERGSKLLLAHIRKLPPRFDLMRPGHGLPDAVEWTVRRCLEKDPAKRFCDVQQLRTALRVCRLALVRPRLNMTLRLQNGRLRAHPELVEHVAMA